MSSRAASSTQSTARSDNASILALLSGAGTAPLYKDRLIYTRGVGGSIQKDPLHQRPELLRLFDQPAAGLGSQCHLFIRLRRPAGSIPPEIMCGCMRTDVRWRKVCHSATMVHSLGRPACTVVRPTSKRSYESFLALLPLLAHRLSTLDNLRTCLVFSARLSFTSSVNRAILRSFRSSGLRTVLEPRTTNGERITLGTTRRLVCNRLLSLAPPAVFFSRYPGIYRNDSSTDA